MEPGYWHKRWDENRIGFHMPAANPLLENQFEKLDAEPGSLFFVPLCGKSLDIAWLLGKGMNVIGCEINESAVASLFEELGVTPEIRQESNFKCYAKDELKVFVGDFFRLTREDIGLVDFVYDRAAYVALPGPMRSRYQSHLTEITQTAPQLLITLCYEEHLGDGPPFRITDQMVMDSYQSQFQIQMLDRHDYEKGFKGKHPLTETAWKLCP